MAFNYSPKIVTDGLVFAVDAANKKSYPGSGTTWSDLSGNGNNGTLTNGPTFGSGNGGSIDFDASNDVVYNTTLDWTTLNSTFTIDTWVYPTKTVNDSTIIGGQWAIDGGKGFLLYLDVGDGAYGYDFAIRTPSGLARFGTTDANATANAWQNVVVTYSTSEMKLYVNNTLRNTISSPGTFTVSSTPGIGIGTENYNNVSRLWGGKIASAKIYNSYLNSTEISQNYNALKSRFGL